ncbi:hypothetical protein BIFCAT_01483 [Bifidobacterium catenulatum DSM 16992 = JCM 1194 = LMG 11043]|uniref:Uncharacterized protein n=1 Tax=Bifidobacterium catenulatum DSM 16992 = JCM 1194 = LMG 11043 TaxID=566552 RepID=B6XW93_9BIFI|nr:hypothetical protein BIFCAT_01483 [Bifidobacterium catenulatum DSM 16992 = JCM 1194 = LMG 11043]
MFLIFRISQIDIVCNTNKRHVAALMATPRQQSASLDIVL